MSYGYEYGGGGGGGGGGGYADNSYGGADFMGGGYGGDGGNGFLPDTGNSAGKNEKKEKRDKQSMMPVTIKQLNSATHEDNTYRIDNADVHNVIIMGVVESIEEHSTSTTFKINDGTGTIDAKLWNEKNGNVSALAARVSNCRTNTFIKIIGDLRDFENRRHILIYDINPLADWNELTHHLFQVMFVHLQNTKGPIPGSQAAVRLQQPSGQASSGNFQGHRQGTPGHHNMGMQQQMDHNAAPKAVLIKAFETSQEYEGMSLDQCKAYLRENGHNLDDNTIRKMVTDLSEEGLIYSTTDESHYAITR